MKDVTKTYRLDDLVVKWQSHKCIHSAICFHGLPTVFDPRNRPWINMDGANKQDIIEQVKRCPSGALSFEADQQA